MITKEQADRLARNYLIFTYAVTALVVWWWTQDVFWTIASVIIRGAISGVLMIFGVHEKGSALVDRLFARRYNKTRGRWDG